MEPLFIFGITHRSGTNFLGQLLNLHPDCRLSTVLYEDYLLSASDFLINYVNYTSNGWDPEWGDLDEAKFGLARSIGHGLINFVHNGEKKSVVLKTPCTLGIRNFFYLFPEARPILLIRNGKDTCESMVKSFSLSYESTFEKWRESVCRVIDFIESSPKNSFCIVKYENLILTLEEEIKRIFTFFNLDYNKYNINDAYSLPLLGSSIEVDKGRTIHWDPVEKKSDFNPLSRSKEWGDDLHDLFEKICGEEARTLEQLVDQLTNS